MGIANAHARRVKGVLLVAAYLLFSLVVAYVLMEYPYNPDFFFTVEPEHAAQSLLVLALILVPLLLLGQGSPVVAGLFWAACFLLGCANHLVMGFRGTPIIPSDLLALDTAAQVAEGYVLSLDLDIAAGALLLVAALAVLAALFRRLPSWQPNARQRLVCVLLGAAMALGSAMLFVTADAKTLTGATIRAFHMDRTYQQNGTALSCAILCQQLWVKEPDGYSDQAALDAMDRAAKDLAARGVAVAGEGAASAKQEEPTVIAVMNETFADLTIFQELRECPQATLAGFNRIAEESVASGYVYVPCYGAGTCNSEFEFLTGASLSFMGAGSYPYLYYDLGQTQNLARFFAQRGYATSAIHPAEAANWNRDRVYGALGFDRFYAIESFPDADQLREKTTDRETYAKVLELLDQNDGPQFIFDVTYQNHGGYAKHLVDEDRYVHAQLNGGENPELNEYLSCLQCSDRDLEWLVKQLKQRSRPVILVLFGDHLPGLTNQVCKTKPQMTKNSQVLQSVKRYTTPYVIWANYDLEAPDALAGDTARKSLFATTTGYDPVPRLNESANQANMSLNYLGSALLECTGLPLDDYFAFNAQIHHRVPVICPVGVMDGKTNWHTWDQDEGQDLECALSDYQLVQHWNLFRRERP